MTWSEIEGNWPPWGAKIRQRWDKLTENDLTLIAGKRDRLIAFLQERYGKTRDHLNREIEEFCAEQGQTESAH